MTPLLRGTPAARHRHRAALLPRGGPDARLNPARWGLVVQQGELREGRCQPACTPARAAVTSRLRQEGTAPDGEQDRYAQEAQHLIQEEEQVISGQWGARHCRHRHCPGVFGDLFAADCECWKHFGQRKGGWEIVYSSTFTELAPGPLAQLRCAGCRHMQAAPRETPSPSKAQT